MAVDLSALGDLGPVKTDPSQFVLDDSAQQAAPIPPPPDVARYIPTSTIEQAQRQQQADEWDQQTRQKIADMWEQQTQATQDQAVRKWLTPPQYGPPTPTTYQPVQPQADQEPQPDVNPVTAEPAQNPVVQQFLDGLGGLVDKMKPTPEQAQPGDTTKVLPTLESVLTPAGEALNRLTGGASGELAGKLGNIPLGDLASKAQQLGIAGDVTPEDIQQMPGKDLTVGDVASGAASLVQPTPAGPVPGAALTPAGRAAGVANVLEGASPAAEIAGAAEPVAREALTADHPLVQAAADATPGNVVDGVQRPVSAAAVARTIHAKNFDPEAMAKASGRLSPTQTAALAAWKASQDPEIASAVSRPAAPETSVANAKENPAGAGPAWTWPDGTPIQPIEPKLGGAEVPNIEDALGGPKAPADVLENAPPPYTGAGDSTLANNPVVSGLNAVQGILKQAILAGSIFHPLVETAQLGRTALAEGKIGEGAQAALAANRSLLDTGFARQFAEDNADVIQRAEAAGATQMRIGGELNPDVQQVGNRIARTLLSSTGAGITGYATGKAQGESNEDALKRGALFAAGGAGIAQFSPQFTQAMFGRMIPVAKVEAFKMLEPTYGAEVAAKRINDTFGGQNLAKLGRNPEVQTILKSTFLAPDWLESWARNMGAVVKPGPEGDAARKFWAATGASSAVALEGMNYALNGHLTTDNEPGRQLQLEITPIVHAMGGDPTKRYYADVLQLGPLGSTLQAGARGGIGAVGANLATGHLNVAPGIALDALQNRSPVGGQIVSQGTPAEQAAIPEAAAAAARITPVGVSSFEKSDVPPAAEAVSGLTGIRVAGGPTGVAKTKAANPMAPAGSAPRAANLSKLRTFLSGPAVKAGSPMAPRAKPNSNLSKLRTLS